MRSSTLFSRIVPIVGLTLVSFLPALAQQHYFIPQVVDGETQNTVGEFYQTEFQIMNLSGAAAQVTLTLYKNDGTGMGALWVLNPQPFGGNITGTITFSVDPNATRTVSTIAGPALQVGWAEIQSDRELGIVTVLKFGDYSIDGVIRTMTSVLTPPLASRICFPTRNFDLFIDGGTGLALLNPSESESAEAQVSFFDREGTLAGTAVLDLQPRTKRVQFLHEVGLFPELGPSAGGSVRISSTQPLSAVVIRVDDIYWSTYPAFGNCPP